MKSSLCVLPFVVAVVACSGSESAPPTPSEETDSGAIAEDSSVEAGPSADCTDDSQCDPGVTSPPNCAVGKCNSFGKCEYRALDRDGDGHAAKTCGSPGKSIITEDDCDDDDKQTYPGAWDGPADESAGKPNKCDGKDNDCSGAKDDGRLKDGTNCSSPCKPGATRSCFTAAAPAKPGTGPCKAGTETCVVVSGEPRWGACEGEIGPLATIDSCDAPPAPASDANCDGTPNNGFPLTTTICQCTNGSSDSMGCGGTCVKGQKTCVAGKWGACVGAKDPAACTAANGCAGSACEGAMCMAPERVPCTNSSGCPSTKCGAAGACDAAPTKSVGCSRTATILGSNRSCSGSRCTTDPGDNSTCTAATPIGCTTSLGCGGYSCGGGCTALQSPGYWSSPFTERRQVGGSFPAHTDYWTWSAPTSPRSVPVTFWFKVGSLTGNPGGCCDNTSSSKIAVTVRCAGEPPGPTNSARNKVFTFAQAWATGPTSSITCNHGEAIVLRKGDEGSTCCCGCSRWVEGIRFEAADGQCL